MELISKKDKRLSIILSLIAGTIGEILTPSEYPAGTGFMAGIIFLLIIIFIAIIILSDFTR
jgi:hypothetical protein